VPKRMKEVIDVEKFALWSVCDMGTAYRRKLKPKNGIVSQGIQIDSDANVYRVGIGRPVFVDKFDDVQTALQFSNEYARFKGGWL
jgi:hypothetical protein